MNKNEPEQYCITVRFRRTTHEDAYINVPVTDAIMRKNEDGTGRIDPESLVSEGVRLSQTNSVEWKQEETIVEPHPIQKPIPEDRTVFDIHY